MLEKLLPAASTYAKEIDWLFDFITYLVGFWFFLAIGVFFYLVFRYRRKPEEKAQYITGETHKQKMAIEVPHYLILVCDLAILIFTFVVWHQVKIDKPPAEDEVRIVAQQWAWTFYHSGADGLLGTDDDIAKVNELHVKADTVYHYTLQSPDVMHSFSVPVFRLKQDAIPGRDITGWFEPNLQGEWDIQCAEMCGVAHGIMGARIFVKSEEDHAAWIAANSPPAQSANLIAQNTENDSQAQEDNTNG